MSSVTAIVWDFDGTLADTRARNLSVTRRILERLTGRAHREIAALRSVTAYEAALGRWGDWREVYQNEYGLTPEEVETAGGMWAEYQHSDATAAPLFDGVREVLAELAHLPHGVVSLNARALIARWLDGEALGERFGSIVGYEEVAPRRQKPAPDGLLRCLAELATEAGRILFVGDHDTDVLCARNTAAELRRQGSTAQVVAVGVGYGPAALARDRWSAEPDHELDDPRRLLDLVKS